MAHPFNESDLGPNEPEPPIEASLDFASTSLMLPLHLTAAKLQATDDLVTPENSPAPARPRFFLASPCLHHRLQLPVDEHPRALSHPLRHDDNPPQHRRRVEFLAAKHGDSVAEHSRLPFARSQPHMPLIPDPFDRSGSANFGFSSGHQHLNKEAEERAIKEKGFYLHPPSPRTPSEPRLLALFTATSPRGARAASGSSSSS